MQELVRGSIAVVVVWVLLGALATGAALPVNISGTLGDDRADGIRTSTIEQMADGVRIDTIKEMAIYTRPHGSTEVAGVVEDPKVPPF
jgi:hypothetical protein